MTGICLASKKYLSGIFLWGIDWGMNKLSQYLEAKKIKQSDFAKLIDATQATVSRLASGAMTPSPDLALRIDEVTGGEVSFPSWYKRDTAA